MDENSTFESDNNYFYDNITIPTNLTQILFTNNNSTEDNDEDNDNFDINFNTFLTTSETIGHYLAFYYTPILILTGSLGNILSVFVFFKTKLKKLSSSYYLAALAISDTCFLFGSLIQWLNFIDISLYNREFLCQFLTFFSSLCSFLSVWFVVAFTVERFIAVMYPLKRQTMCTVKRAKLVLSILTLIGAIQYMPYIYLASPIYSAHTNSTICDVRLECKNYMTILNYIDTLIVFVIPFTTIVILNTFTGCTVWKFATVRRTMTTHKRKPSTSVKSAELTEITYRRRSSSSTTTTASGNLRKQISLTNCSHPNGRNSITTLNSTKSGRRKITNSSQIKVTKMLLIVSTVFVCLNLPYYMIRIRAYLEPQPTRTTIIMQYISWFLFLTNFGINFVLYCVSGQNFRRAVISMFRKATLSSAQREGATQVTVSDYVRNNSGVRTSRRRTLTQTGSWGDVHELKHVISFKEKNLE